MLIADTYLEREGGSFLQILGKLPVVGDGLLILTSLEAVDELDEGLDLCLQLPACLGSSIGNLAASSQLAKNEEGGVPI